MKIAHVVALVFLAVWLLLTGIVGLAAIPVPHFLGIIMNLLALIAGILFLITVGRCCCYEKCNYDHTHDTK